MGGDLSPGGIVNVIHGHAAADLFGAPTLSVIAIRCGGLEADTALASALTRIVRASRKIGRVRLSRISGFPDGLTTNPNKAKR